MSINTDAFDVEESTPETRDKKLAAKEAAAKLLQGMTYEQQLAMAGLFIKKQVEATTAVSEDAPKTPDELWDYIFDTWGVRIARVAVCHDHDAPFDFICFGFFELVPNLFCIGPRGGGKSYDTALLMELNSRWKPGCESMVFGAVDEQNRKVFQDMVEIFINGGMENGESEIVGEALASLVQFVNGSRVKSYPGTKAKMNGQHPPKAHAEEVEIFKNEAYGESRNMAADKIMKDGRVIKAQNFGTSTRKYKNGRVDKIYQAFLKAKKIALEKFGKTQVDEEVREYITITSPWYCVIYCLFEIAAQVPNCRSAPENFGRPEHELCKCNVVQHGTWDKDGREPRTLETVCKGRLYRSRGHRSYGEVVQLFLQNERGPWEAQQECIEAETEGVYVQHFSRRRHGLSFFPIDPSNGPFYTGTDWGTTHYACTLWCQYLERDVEAIDYQGKKKVLPSGSRVVIAEFYEDGLTSYEMGERVIVKEVKLAASTSFARLPIRKRWADVQGAGDKKVWRKMGLPTKSYGSRVFSEHVKEVRGKFEADRAFVVVAECPHYCDEIEAWREDEKGDEVDENFNHAMAAGRYLFFGMLAEYNDPGALHSEGQKQVEQALQDRQAVPDVAIAAYDEHQYANEEDAWRAMV